MVFWLATSYLRQRYQYIEPKIKRLSLKFEGSLSTHWIFSFLEITSIRSPSVFRVLILSYRCDTTLIFPLSDISLPLFLFLSIFCSVIFLRKLSRCIICLLLSIVFNKVPFPTLFLTSPCCMIINRVYFFFKQRNFSDSSQVSLSQFTEMVLLIFRFENVSLSR